MRFDFVFAFHLIVSHFLAVAQDEIKPQCSTNKVACGATLYEYPLLEEENGDFSGYGSGVVPVYDEVLTHDEYDLSATPTSTNFEICSCGEDQKCDFEADENSVKIDYHVTLRFCNLTQIPNQCARKSPSQVRVIGNAQTTGDTVVNVTNAMMFCNCAGGYKRDKVENWGGSEISLNYKCL